MGTGGVALMGTGSGTAGHWWVAPLGTDGRHCWALVDGTAGHRWVALLETDHQGTDPQCPDDGCRSLL
ncbi:unnamed protein product [Staurois parvus]|uniref:Uncharacterized protein n=1 Tax=Staurois parvus TaxID=386267 RepID=A0ABN9D219_9NEOB|nr:unnamed protein product [Staurois parvus]